MSFYPLKIYIVNFVEIIIMKNNLLKSILFLFISLLLTQMISAQSLSDSLKAHYTFDRTTLDSSPAKNDLNYSSTVKWSSFAGQDSAIYFDGNARTKSINSFDNSYYNETAIAMWIRVSPSTTSSGQTIIQGAYMGFGVYITSNNELAAFFDTPSTIAFIATTTNVVDSNWHHIVAQNNGDSTIVYIDGRLEGRKYQPLNVGNGGSNNELYLGKSSKNTKAYKGSINDLRIYNRILTQNEIDTLSDVSQLLTSLSKYKKSITKTILYPNPTTGNASITYDSRFYGGVFQLKNILGQTIFKENLKHNGIVDFHINDKSGMYFVELIGLNGNKSISKIVKH